MRHIGRVIDGEPDLYPPDVEVVTPEAHEHRKRAMVGAAVLTMGAGLLLERAVHHDLHFLMLTLGVALLAGWARAPRYKMFVAGAIFTGFGLGNFFESLVHMRFETTVSTLLGAAGFAAIYVRYPKRSSWALVPAAIFALFAVADFGFGVIGLLGSLGDLMLPLALIAAGALLLFRRSLPRRAVVIGLIVAVAVFVSSAASNVDELHGDAGPMGFTGPRRIEFSSDGGLSVHTVSGDITVDFDPGVDHPTISREGTGPADAVHVRMPPDTAITVKTVDGDVTITHTDAGELDPTLQLATVSGNITVDGDDADGDAKDFERPGDEGAKRITVHTVSGDIDVETAA